MKYIENCMIPYIYLSSIYKHDKGYPVLGIQFTVGIYCVCSDWDICVQ